MVGFIFGGNTGVTQADLSRQRELAQALAKRRSGAPRNVGEGLTFLGEALAYRIAQSRANRMEDELQGQFEGALEEALPPIPGVGGSTGGYEAPPPSPPSVPDTMRAEGVDPPLSFAPEQADPGAMAGLPLQGPDQTNTPILGFPQVAPTLAEASPDGPVPEMEGIDQPFADQIAPTLTNAMRGREAEDLAPRVGVPDMPNPRMGDEQLSFGVQQPVRMSTRGAPVNATPDERRMLAITLDAEAGGEGVQGMLDAGSVIMNRLATGHWGNTLNDVIMAPGQFSAWNSVTGYAGGEQGQNMNREPSAEAMRAADALLSGQYEDQTGGATHYYAPWGGTPSWANDSFVRRGGHYFGRANAGIPEDRLSRIGQPGVRVSTKDAPMSGPIAWTNEQERDAAFMERINAGEVAPFVGNTIPVEINNGLPDGIEKVVFNVGTSPIAVQGPNGPVLMPASANLGRQAASALGGVLPTRGIVDALYSQQRVRPMATQDPGPGMTGPDAVMAASQAMFGDGLSGPLVGANKEVLADGGYYGGARPDGGVWQPYRPLAEAHSDDYADYSHGARLVTNATVYPANGEPYQVPAAELYSDPQYSGALGLRGPVQVAQGEPNIRMSAKDMPQGGGRASDLIPYSMGDGRAAILPEQEVFRPNIPGGGQGGPQMAPPSAPAPAFYDDPTPGKYDPELVNKLYDFQQEWGHQLSPGRKALIERIIANEAKQQGGWDYDPNAGMAGYELMDINGDGVMEYVNPSDPRAPIIPLQGVEAPETGYEIISPQEAATMGLPELADGNVYQRNRETGKIEPLRSGPLVENNMGGGNVFASDFFEDRYATLQTEAASAANMLGMYDIAESALASGVETGFGAEAEQTLRRIGSRLGLDVDEEKLAGGELLNAVTNRMALLMRNPDSGMGMPGAVSDRDLTFLRDAQIGLDRSPEGNLRMLKAFRALEQRKIELARMADAYIAQNGQLDPGFNQMVREYAQANPIFTEEMFSGATVTAAPESMGPPAPAQGGLTEDERRFLEGN